MGMKSGSGDLDFGGDEEDEEEPTTTDEQETAAESPAESSTDSPASTPEPQGSTAEEYPYFVRRSGVMDERDKRIEVHLRPEVASQEAAYRQALAEALDVDEVSKTDAREFALRAAFEDPESVAALMEEEGFGVL